MGLHASGDNYEKMLVDSGCRTRPRCRFRFIFTEGRFINRFIFDGVGPPFWKSGSVRDRIWEGLYLTDDLWRELHLLWRPNSNERTCGFLLGHLMGWDWYFTDCIYLFYVGELAWEFGHGQAQALWLALRSACLNLVFELGHVQLMLTHPLYTHTLWCLILFHIWAIDMMWLYCNSTFVCLTWFTLGLLVLG